MSRVTRLYRPELYPDGQVIPDQDRCFYIETSKPLTESEMVTLRWLLAETFMPHQLRHVPDMRGIPGDIVEVGPRMNFETADSTNAVAICHACGLTSVTRLEVSRRFRVPNGQNAEEFTVDCFDRMTEEIYTKPLSSFAIDAKPEPVYEVPLMAEGESALRRINKEMGLGMDDWDISYYTNLFVNDIGRNPTNVECFQLGQANSEHSRHWFFTGKQEIDGVEMPETLLQVIKSTLKANPGNSVIAFSDNSSAIKGYRVWTIVPEKPGQCSRYRKGGFKYHIVFTAETHNYPSGVEPFQGACTGTGGRQRDNRAPGRGALLVLGSAGYCVGALKLEGFRIPGEPDEFVNNPTLASPSEILIRASDGASTYGNQFGEPVALGFCRSFDLVLPNEERRAWLKPIMFTGGLGQIDARHCKKGAGEVGMLICQIGGPAYRIGVGGGSASSMIQGANDEALDFNAVQRGNAEMGNKANRAVRACVELGEKNPIVTIHDQGAGGPCNVLTELIEKTGGRIRLRDIIVGDVTMSVVEIWGAEYQERDALLVMPEDLDMLRMICAREKVNLEILGEVTDTNRVVLYDEETDTTPVDLPLDKILADMPQKTFTSERREPVLEPLSLPDSLTVAEALERVFRLVSVCSKGFLTRKVDRSVTGLVAQQQCCGPLQLPVADCAVMAQSHFETTGAATSIGEQPVKVLLDPAAGARMAVGESITNLAGVLISSLADIKASVNWMWAAKLPHEGAAIYDAAVALRDLMIRLGIAADGGKDSLSMATKVGDEIVKSPGQVVVSNYVTVPDITRVVTPDIKQPGKSRVMFINLAPNEYRLGGSALAQSFGQLGDKVPDVNADLLIDGFVAIQRLIEHDLVLACHDRSDGGLITTLLEMAMSGNAGLDLQIPEIARTIDYLFNEELGWVIEYAPEKESFIMQLLADANVPCKILGKTQQHRSVRIRRAHAKELLFEATLDSLIRLWESTSDQLELLQMNPDVATEQAENHGGLSPTYHVPFLPQCTPVNRQSCEGNPKVAILREEGSNGDREMTSAFFEAGFEVWDVTMTDLLSGKVTLDMFQGLVAVGGFSYKDTLDSAKGWAGVIRFNPELRKMFSEFYERGDTFSLGVCNGCQLFSLLGWVPGFARKEEQQPRFVRNLSERFESRWSTVMIPENNSIMLQGMAGSVLGIWVAHGEGRLFCPDAGVLYDMKAVGQVALQYVDPRGCPTVSYPYNPNGSPDGITGICSVDGRHLAIMPHPERAFLQWQWPWMPQEWQGRFAASPWLRMFQNAYDWCVEQQR